MTVDLCRWPLAVAGGPQSSPQSTVHSPLTFETASVNLIENINYISIASFALCCFVLLSYVVLPAEKSHRHYLNVGLLCILIPFHASSDHSGREELKY